MIKSQSSRELDHIKKDISSLKADFKSFAGALGKNSSQSKSFLQNRISDIENWVPDTLNETYQYAVEQGEQAVDTTRRQVEKYPLPTLFGALFLGAALTMLVVYPRR
jgi:ElaB/YqjD/DUF883 family membrane-anchored ribosome-binding protein